MDFNVDHVTSAIAAAWRDDRGLCVCFFDEVYEHNSNTTEMAQILKKRFPHTSIYVCPDPTGGRRQSSSNGMSDFTLLERAGFKVLAPRHPHATRDKINVMNAALCSADGTRRVMIAEGKCPHLRDALKGYTYMQNGQPDKRGGLDRISDAAAYLVNYLLR